MRRLLLLAALGACAPTVDGPVAEQRLLDRADADRLAAQLAALPGVMRAEVMLRRPVVDPLATSPAPPAAASLVVIVDDKADRTRIEQAARALVKPLLDTEPTVIVEVGAHRPELANVGPFTVEASSKTALKATLALALVAIAALAGWIALRARR